MPFEPRLNIPQPGELQIGNFSNGDNGHIQDVLVAVRNGEVIGWLVYEMQKDTDVYTASINYIETHEGRVRQGIGTALFKESPLKN